MDIFEERRQALTTELPLEISLKKRSILEKSPTNYAEKRDKDDRNTRVVHHKFNNHR